MIEVFKILHGIYDRDITDGILHLAQNDRTRGHSLKLITQSSRLELRRNSFSVRVVRPWNALPESVVSSPSVKVFESLRLDEVWKNQPVRFNFNSRAPIWI